jgi:SOS-response transcriptional repressor LexA
LLNPRVPHAMEPIYVPAAQVAIQGRVLGVLRKYK